MIFFCGELPFAAGAAVVQKIELEAHQETDRYRASAKNSTWIKIKIN